MWRKERHSSTDGWMSEYVELARHERETERDRETEGERERERDRDRERDREVVRNSSKHKLF